MTTSSGWASVVVGLAFDVAGVGLHSWQLALIGAAALFLGAAVLMGDDL